MTIRPSLFANADTEVFWKNCNEGIFLYQRCNDCGRSQFYPRTVCRGCKGHSLSWQESTGIGEIYSFTVVHRATSAFSTKVPYVLALVDLSEGFRIMANVMDCDPISLRIGQTVHIVFEERGTDRPKLPQVIPRI